MKVLFHYDAGPRLRKKLEALQEDGLDLVICPEPTPKQELIEILQDVEVIWHVLEPLTRDILEHAGKLRLIQKIGVGTNTIDMEWAKEKGIAVCNMPGSNARATAEMALLLILAASRRLPLMDKACRSGAWYVDKDVEESLTEIKGKTIGLVGFGAVASLLAEMLEAMGARVIYTARQQKPDVSYQFVPFEQLLKSADVISLHASLNVDTEKMINESTLAQMKTGAILVNTARGALIDELAVYAALLTGKLAAAGFDVFATEPVKPDNKLLSLENVVLAPHLGWLTQETLERSVAVARENCQRLKHDELLQFRVV